MARLPYKIPIPVGPSSDTGHSVVRDPRTGKYLAYGRFAPAGGRVIGCITSDDFEPGFLDGLGQHPGKIDTRFDLRNAGHRAK